MDDVNEGRLCEGELKEREGLDEEWIELIQQARALGLSKIEVLRFLRIRLLSLQSQTEG
ncbi:anti-repressor SinI family protein [Alicyclobacillus sp. ALC3]|uniref:anti-repressor SinI family protein n=1 Tax=Alicyclobacillus sp. ALC3 TaxID=2796143 RepID=UPI002379934F|nr:anti-repressor SinI family protein [Alicyclobacillus sp. ALC3]WDL98198.1 anti-repressor SinI family protein [Alicyclobacillus sp. ALC3]